MKLICDVINCAYNKSATCTQDEISINLASDEYEYAYCTKYKESDESIRSNYEIIKLENQEYDYLILSKSSARMFNHLEYIGKDLKILDNNLNNKVRVITDGLLSRGNYSNRYMEFEWDFIEDDAFGIREVAISRGDEIRKVSAEYYRQHSELIEYSILTSTQKKLLLKGIVI